MVTITVPGAYDADASIEKAELKSYLGTGLIISGIVQADILAGSGIITNTGPPTVDPNAAWYDPALLNAATRVLALYHGGKARAVGIPWGYTAYAGLPAIGDIDERYLITDMGVVVHYLTAVADEVMSGTGNGLAGWHPLSGGYGLFINNSGGTINQGEAVRIGTGVSPTREVVLAGEKSQFVIGVAMHTVLTGNNIIVALLGCQDVIQVKIDPTLTIGGAACPTSRGDAIVSRVNGIGRSVGLFPLGTVSAPVFRYGVPHGAYAIALKDRAAVDGIGLTPCRMLGAIGQGCTVMTNRPICLSDITPNTAYQPFFPTKASTDAGAGDNGAQSATESLLIETKYAPVVRIGIEFEFDGDDGTAGIEALVEFSTDGATVNDVIRNKRYGSATHRFIERATIPVLQTGTPGQTSYRWTGTPVYGTITTWRLRLANYVY